MNYYIITGKYYDTNTYGEEITINIVRIVEASSEQEAIQKTKSKSIIDIEIIAGFANMSFLYRKEDIIY